MDDPDHRALVYVQQYLHEGGFKRALHELEAESGFVYDDAKLERGGELMQLIWEQLERSLAECPNEQAQERAEDEALLQEGVDDFPQRVAVRIEGAHPANILCVKLVPGSPDVITGSGDGRARRACFETSHVSWCTPVGGGGALCVDLHPQHSRGHDLAALGSMSGSVSLVHTQSGACLASSCSHGKYAGTLAWTSDGTHLVSGSHDHSVVVHRYTSLQRDGDGSSECSSSQQAEQQQSQLLVVVKRVEFLSVVQSIAPLHDGRSVVIAVRDSNLLRLLDTHDQQAELTTVNLNASGDDYVSFFACHLALSPCGRCLLASTNKGRLILLRQRGGNHRDWRCCPALGHMQLAVEQFHNFSAAWHRDSRHVFAAAAGAQVWVFHCGTGKVKAKLDVHKVNVRNMDCDGQRLATCSFDKSVNLLLPP